MKGLFEVSARSSNKVITGEVYGSLSDKQTLFARLMNRFKVKINDRYKWKLQDVKLKKQIDD